VLTRSSASQAACTTATGADALFNNTTGSYNTANGAFTLTNGIAAYYYNTATGFEALETSTGDNNTATGALALQADTTGYYRVIIAKQDATNAQ